MKIYIYLEISRSLITGGEPETSIVSDLSLGKAQAAVGMSVGFELGTIREQEIKPK